MVIVVTNRKLCAGDFLARLDSLCRAKPGAVLLREKDLPESDYAALARSCQEICVRQEVPLILHGHPQIARELGLSQVHLPLPALEAQAAALCGLRAGTSVHSVEDVRRAQALGASYLIAGHIFSTACKPGLPARGLRFLGEVCRAAKVPVYAIGGVQAGRVPDVLAQGAAGFCIMSELMECPDPYERLSSYIDIETAASLG
ncbi:thiamine phosphate synthase [Zongyangia hominis]|uniref:Thiamine phosphate synthase n=1 Tax=Zongyangia hominis TaxID=2763677 RepID=A0A926EFB7_9FIRM|nr:thiamine phosphate synthase [Zongyangia hominis]MBC8570806.1 thiamine phosphate synthase [Zongyangia hominis]